MQTDLLDRVRKLLAKAEDEGCTPEEAEALTAKAADLMAALATALRCQCVQTQTEDGPRLHVFGYSSDLERAEILFTSLLVQMARALAQQVVPAYGNSAKAWRRSWMLGYCAAVVARVRAAEEAAVASAGGDDAAAADGATSAALVLADRSLTVRLQVSAAYPRLKKKRVTYSGS